MGTGYPDHEIGLLAPHLIPLAICTFAACALTAATGATSLLTVPLMIQFGVEPRTAIATNMALLVLMNLGSSFGFYGADYGSRQRLMRLVGLTLVGSIAGALLLLQVPTTALRLVVPCAMIAVLLILLATRRHSAGLAPPSLRRLEVGYGVMFVLGIYGGFFSGGYVTIVVVAFTFFFACSFLQAISLARILNFVSSLAAAVIFAWRGAIDWQLGWVLGLVAFAGAFIGARLARRLPELCCTGLLLQRLQCWR